MPDVPQVDSLVQLLKQEIFLLRELKMSFLRVSLICTLIVSLNHDS